MILKNKKINALFLLIGFFIVMGFMSTPPKSEGAGNYFGGKVMSKTPCTCSTGHQVTIQGPGDSSGTYLDTGAIGYKYYFASPGRNILGTYSASGSCRVIVTVYPKTCKDLEISKGTISPTTGVSSGFGGMMMSF